MALAHSLIGSGRVREGLKLFERLAASRTDNPWLLFQHGRALYDQGHFREAADAYRAVLALSPKLATAHNNLGVALKAQGKLDGAIAAYRKAIEIDPKYPPAHNNLGLALKAQGKLDEAIAALRQAVAIDPKYALAHSNLGTALCDDRDFEGALAAYRRAFEPNPGLTKHRAAGAAAMTADGQGKNAVQFDDRERSRRRQQALDWLRADLLVWTKHVESGNAASRPAVEKALRGWQSDATLRSVRDAKALEQLPEAERDAWRKFWADVDALLKRAEPPK